MSKITFITLTFEKEREKRFLGRKEKRWNTSNRARADEKREKIRAERQTHFFFKWGDEFFFIGEILKFIKANETHQYIHTHTLAYTQYKSNRSSSTEKTKSRTGKEKREQQIDSIVH